MGRKKIELTNEEIQKRNLVARHLRDFREAVSWTQEKLAGKLYVDVSTLRRWESGRWAMNKSVAGLLEQMTGFIKEYWMGLTDLTNREVYNDYIANEAFFEVEEKEMDDRIIKSFEERVEAYSTMFRLCGYYYECLASHSSIWDMYQIIDPNPELEDGVTWHRLTLLKDPNKEYYFTTKGINEIVNRIKDVADLACLRDNENDRYDGFDGRMLDPVQNENGGKKNAEKK